VPIVALVLGASTLVLEGISAVFPVLAVRFREE
jgi:hypothetical protein